MLERGRWTSYSACGIPYLVGGSVDDIDDLVARSPETFRDRHDIDVRLGHEAGRSTSTPAGSRPGTTTPAGVVRIGSTRCTWPGAHARCGPTCPASTTRWSTACRRSTTPGPGSRGPRGGLGRPGGPAPGRVVGGGYIGLEMAEAFVQRGLEVTLVEAAPQVMPTLDADVAAPLVEALGGWASTCAGRGSPLEAVEDGASWPGASASRPTWSCWGSSCPNAELAAEAGLEVGVTGPCGSTGASGTSADGVWAAGDCCESHHLVARRPVHIALGTVANKQGRVAGINIAGGYAAFPGRAGHRGHQGVQHRDRPHRPVLGRVRALRLRHGRGEHRGRSPGRLPPRAQADHGEGLAEVGTGRMLGAQIVGEEGTAKRIDVLATAIQAGLTADEVVDLDLGYAPPFGPCGTRCTSWRVSSFVASTGLDSDTF